MFDKELFLFLGCLFAGIILAVVVYKAFVERKIKSWRRHRRHKSEDGHRD